MSDATQEFPEGTAIAAVAGLVDWAKRHGYENPALLEAIIRRVRDDLLLAADGSLSEVSTEVIIEPQGRDQ